MNLLCFWNLVAPSPLKRFFQIHEQRKTKKHLLFYFIVLICVCLFVKKTKEKTRAWAKPFEYTVLGSYFMKINDMLTK